MAGTPDSPLVVEYDLDGRRADRPRNEGRSVVRLEVASATSIAGHRLEAGEHYLAVYDVEVPHVEARVRTSAHEQAMASAKSMAKAATERWVDSRLGDLTGAAREAEAEKLRKLCPIFWSQAAYLRPAGDALGIDTKGGIPPLTACDYVRDYGAPMTRENAAALANQNLAAAITAAIEASSGSKRSRSSSNG